MLQYMNVHIGRSVGTQKSILPHFTLVMLLLTVSAPQPISAQISEGGLPPSFNYSQDPQLRSAGRKTEVPVDFYIKDLQEVDNWRSSRQGAPLPIGKLIPVNYTPENAGAYTTFPGGERVWRLHLRAADAVAIMLYYKDFHIPEGGKLFIYSADKTQLLGAYTHNTHPTGGLFATEFVGGDELILEYLAPETGSEKPRIHISEIGYGYNLSALETLCGDAVSLRRSSSGSCMVDINCEEGLAWQDEKRSVCYMTQKIGDANYMCTGSLINNTAEDLAPLILTALHCAYDKDRIADESDLEQWQFYFHHEREGCGETSPPAQSKTMTGCKMLVGTGLKNGSDGMLLMLSRQIPETYNVYYNGWDRRNTPPLFGVSIHHPRGDYKKISTYDTPAKETTFNSTEFTAARSAHWNVTFRQTANGHGVTESGSSGSPLYNENKQLVGTLTGGNSSCASPEDLNIYGKMSAHWDHSTTAARMSAWLDPVGTGAETLPGRSYQKETKPAPTNLTVENQGHRILLRWIAPLQSTEETPVRYHIYRHNQRIGQATGLFFVDAMPISGSLVYSVSAVYADDTESPFVSATLSYVEYKAPFDLRAERMDNTGSEVKLTWRAPEYEQTIYWGTLNPVWVVGFDEPVFYYGHRWSSEEINPLHEKTLKAVRFVPVENNTYEIYISQGGDYVYRQPIETSTLNYSSMNTVMLNEPFTIDGARSLIVSIYVSRAGSQYPATCDDGPMVNGKGNIYSFDGTTWETLYDETNPGEHNYNFIISAIVSSERGGSSVYKKSVSDRIMEPLTHSRRATPVKTAFVAPYKSSLPSYDAIPIAFPEITSYRIYRSRSVYRDVDPSATHYIDKSTFASSFYYEISAFYGTVESEKSDKAYITTANNAENMASIADIYPTRFSASVSLKGYEAVTRVDIVSVSGKVCLAVNRPSGTIDTSSLAPGLYFFRIYGPNNQVLKVVRAVKISG
jgi:hypothetical protein